MSGPVSDGQWPKLRVVKVGGSLLNSPAIEQIPGWLDRQPTMNNVLIIGGGSHVENIRRSQRETNLTDRDAHWLSIGAMTETAAIVSERLDCTVPVILDIPMRNQTNASKTVTRQATVILNVASFLHRDADRHDALPQNWTVTSDSIAAKIATELKATELVLLKSTMPRKSETVSDLAENGFVDEHFPVVFASPKLRIVNARGRAWPERVLESDCYRAAAGRS